MNTDNTDYAQTTHRLRTDYAQTIQTQYKNRCSVCSVCSVWRTEVRQHKICTLHVAKTESREPHSHSANTKKETK